ncbi:MAG: glutamine--fructose-6-phosphate transaminase (isomerizing) [Opitutales bacterium]|nr:glutamine--fructose-6-phosphate transaminase (isomerizing) [Opitutales bacterium]
MCGIISYIGKEDALQVLTCGLKRLEYRGYDSAGIAIGDDKHPFQVVRSVGRVEQLIQRISSLSLSGKVGIGHTRWATHGGISEKNAHPQTSQDGKFLLVHNGVIENYASLKTMLTKEGFTFSSDTDTEILVNLIAFYYQKLQEVPADKRFVESVRESLLKVQGTYGLVILCTDYPQELIGARKSSPLILGVSEDGLFLASDASAFSGQTKEVVFLRDHEIAHLKGHDFQITDLSNNLSSPVIETLEANTDESDLGPYAHYMQKEIFEQDQALQNTILGRFSADGSSAHLGGLQMTARELKKIERMVLIGCGTAWHACKVGEFLLETYARIPVEVEYASEFRYRNMPLEKNTLVLVVSQSGETLDTLGALQEARRKGFRTLAITNVVGSTIARESDGGVYQRSGKEVGVASTKAFTGQLATFIMLSLHLGRMRDLSFSEGCRLVKALQSLPEITRSVLNACDPIMKELAKKYASSAHFYFLGRQALFPIAMEGALKLKEISYIHAEAYPSGELKHGPIALIDPSMPTMVLASNADMLSKNISSMMEIKARGGKVLALGVQGSIIPETVCDELCVLPKVHEAILPIVTTLPLQLFAYYMALERGCDVDKPRNLAKSVTVE